MLQKIASPDAGFEARLHELVLPSIRSKIPKLVPNMVGFEVLDASDDETRATGIYAFKLGRQTVYIPVVFRDGSIKGLNLMYLADDKLMIPAEEGWVDYVLSRQPFQTGQPMSRSELSKDRTTGSFASAADSFGKFASADAIGGKAADSQFDLLTVLPRLPKQATLSLLRTIQASDTFGRSVFKFYPYEKLAVVADKIVKQPQPTQPSADPMKSGIPFDRKLKIVKLEPGLAADELSDEQRSDIQVDGVAFADNRDETDVTKAVKITAPAQWFSPTESGVYKIMDRQGKIVEALVSSNPVTVGEGRAIGTVAVTKDGRAAFIPRDKITATEEMPLDEWETWVDGLPKLKDADLSNNDEIVLVNKGKQMTPILRVVGSKIKGPSGYATLFVRQATGNGGLVECCPPSPYRRYSSTSRVAPFGVTMDHEEERTPTLDSYTQRMLDKGDLKKSEIELYNYARGRRIVITGDQEGQSLQIAGNQLIVDGDVRVIHVEDHGGELEAPLGDSIWPYIKAAGQGYKKMTVNSRHGEYEIECGLIKSGCVNRRQAMVQLVAVHGMTKDAAREILGMADVAESKRSVATMAVKYAASYPDVEIGDGDNPGIQESYEQMGMNEGAGDPFLSDEINRVNRAAETGQKSFFDAAVLTSLVRRHDIGQAIDDLLPDLTNGLDRLCRVLFLLYVHRDSFEELYGTEDLPQIEDSAENLVKELGDLVLMFRKKSIEKESQMDSDGGISSVL